MFTCKTCHQQCAGIDQLLKHSATAHAKKRLDCGSTLTDSNKRQMLLFSDNKFYNRPIIGDGNCLFRAMSTLLFGTQDAHVFIRDLTSSYIRHMNEKNGRFRFAPRDMSKQGVWCGEEHVVAAIELFDAPFVVCEHPRPPDTSSPRITRLIKEQKCIPMFLKFSQSIGHYEVLMMENQGAFFNENRPICGHLCTFDNITLQKDYQDIQDKLLDEVRLCVKMFT